MSPQMVQLNLDRESVAMGDDMVSHAATVAVSSGTPLSRALAENTPDVRMQGWSWVVVVDGVVSAVWSVDHSVQLVVPDRGLSGGPITVFFRYFAQIDPAWLYAEIAAGAPANRFELEKAWAPVAAERRHAELRRRAREIPDRLLGADCVAALQGLGAEITLHSDTVCEFSVAGQQWSAQRHDSMLVVYKGAGAPRASLRPHAFGEAWLVGAVGAAVREERGLSALPEFEPLPGLDLEKRGARWVTKGPTVAQAYDDRSAQVAVLAHGRTVAEVGTLLEI